MAPLAMTSALWRSVSSGLFAAVSPAIPVILFDGLKDCVYHFSAIVDASELDLVTVFHLVKMGLILI